MPKEIGPFRGEWGWLSNFAPVIIIMRGKHYPSVEHAYAAAKTLDPLSRARIAKAKTPAHAKELGTFVLMRPGWDDMKLTVMHGLLRAKFRQYPYSGLLLDTGDAIIIERNWWHDTYWGVHAGVGQNNLGLLIMQVRDELRNQG